MRGTFRRQPTEAGSPLPSSSPAICMAASSPPKDLPNEAASRRPTCVPCRWRTTVNAFPACAGNPRRPKGDTKKKCGSAAFAACPPGLRRRGVPRIAAFEDLPLRGRCSCWRTTADPRDLHAGFPDATLVLLPELALERTLMGLSKDRPSVVSITGESTPGRCAGEPSPPSFGEEQPALLVFRPRGFSPPRRLAPPWRRACLATRFRPWGSLRFRS